MRQQLRIMLLASLTGFALSPASAQEPVKRSAHYSAPTCDDGKNLVVCIDRVAREAKRRAKDDASGPIGKFAKLAGMFMGRVDAADIGNYKFRFKIELADAHDFVRE